MTTDVQPTLTAAVSAGQARRTPPASTVALLAPADLEILAFERTPWRSQGRKETAVRERFGLTRTRYAHRLAWIIRQPGAELYDPELVRRLRRLAVQRHTARTAGFDGTDR